MRWHPAHYVQWERLGVNRRYRIAHYASLRSSRAPGAFGETYRSTSRIRRGVDRHAGAWTRARRGGARMPQTIAPPYGLSEADSYS